MTSGTGRRVAGLWAAALLALSGPLRATPDAPPSGRALAHGTAKGNCLACHRMPSDPGAETSADIGPPLERMRERFPDRARLRAQIWDAAVANPATIMPPFGRNHVLTDAEIDCIVDYLYTL